MVVKELMWQKMGLPGIDTLVVIPLIGEKPIVYLSFV